ncbi:MAG: STAS domain-containing protein [Magnetospiraceae bacterium]
MDIETETKNGATVIVPKGRIDQSTTSAFQELLLAKLSDVGAGPVVVDMGNVEFISSVGLRALMIGVKSAKAAGGSLVVAALTPMVKEVFQISRFDMVLKCFDDVESALSS